MTSLTSGRKYVIGQLVWTKGGDCWKVMGLRANNLLVVRNPDDLRSVTILHENSIAR